MLAAVIVLTSWTAHAHDESRAGIQVRTHNLSGEIGGNHITAVTRTEDGYLWVGTVHDLYRFNGDRFVSAADLYGIRRSRQA